MDRGRPIGVFDSGLGGLTVVRAVEERLPGERVVYFGDTARLPYGSKSAATVARYSMKSAQFLVDRDVKMLLVACNTASAHALGELTRSFPLPVLGAVEPGADEAVAATARGRVGVIGTLGTIRSGSYRRAIAARDPRVEVVDLACPLLVPLAEEGWLGGGDPLEDDAALAVVRRYLGQLRARAPELDVLVLGCTHYPLLKPLLERVVGELWSHPVRLVDSAHAMARAAAAVLDAGAAREEQAPPGDGAPRLQCFVTDEARFDEVGSRFLGRPLGQVEKVDL